MKFAIELMLKRLAVIITVAFSLLLFAFLIGYVIWVNLTNAKYVQLSRQNEENGSLSGVLLPSQVLSGKAQYNRQRITIRGRIGPEMVVCERKECPAGDTCCGCPLKRNLRIDDTEASLISGSGGQKILRILDAEGQSFCQRSTTSCDYDCQDWVSGGVYDVRGIFLTDTLRVENKALVKKPNPIDAVGNFFLEVKKRIEKLRTSGSYILQ